MLSMVLQGAGQAVAQLDLTYGVDYPVYKVGLVSKAAKK